MIPRRSFLRGAGVALTLPWLEGRAQIGRALGSEGGGAAIGSAAVEGSAASQLAPGGLAHPTRMAFVYVPNGVVKSEWTPRGVGREFELSPTLERLSEHKNDLLVFTNLTQDNGRDKGDGAGDHARGTSVFLTGEHPYKTDGAAIRVGVSVDQLAAKGLGMQTRLASLEIGTEQGARAGNCDSGYSCAYSSAISWMSPTMPMPKEVNPRLVFQRLFGDGPESEEQRKRRDFFRQSVLDVVADDARRLQRALGQTDRRKLDEYFQSVREVEQRIARMAAGNNAPPAGVESPGDVPDDFTAYVRVMYDLLALAFQTDCTRVATYMIGNAGSNRAYTEVDAKEGWHSLSHHQNDAAKLAQLARIDRFQMDQFGYFLSKLKGIAEGEGTLLDHCMILYGSELGDGNGHTHHDLPILLAGRANGSIATGRHLEFPPETPLNNLFLSMLDRMGTPTESLGDSTGPLAGLDG